MKSWKVMLVANVVLLVGLLAVTGPRGSKLNAQWFHQTPCCKTAIEGNPFCCSDCCSNWNHCTLTCEKPKK